MPMPEPAPLPAPRKHKVFGRPTLLVEVERPHTLSFGAVAALPTALVERTDDFEVLATRLKAMYGAVLVPIDRPAPVAALAKEARQRSPGIRTEREFSFCRLHLAPQTKESELLDLSKRVSKEAGVRRAIPLPPAVPAQIATPNLVPSQGYLGATPDGIGMVAVQAPAGESTRVIDVEGDWITDHEAYGRGVSTSPIWGSPVGDVEWRSHGAAVLGILSGRGTPSGIVGIAPACEYYVVSHWDGADSLVYEAINAATPYLGEGDVLLIEAQQPGPSATFQQNDTQQGYIAVEWWDHIFDVVSALTARNTIVVEAAGNGGENLGDATYQGLFDTTQRDSGAILVGAGASPAGAQQARTRLPFSNYGDRVDVQGWGEGVVTAGDGHLFGLAQDLPEDRWYWGGFGGTSSAAAIVAGVVAALQQDRRAIGRNPVSALAMRSLLRNVGSGPAGGGGSGGIGLLPDFAALLSDVRRMP